MRGIVIVVGALCALWSSAARAQDVETELALAVAKVCANERSLGAARPADCALVWQATRRHGETAEERLAWLRAHSSCVLSDREMSAREALGNCRWTRHLADSDARPAGWPALVPWERFVESWRGMRGFVRQLVLEGRRPRGGWPCPVDPDTWGGPMDHARAIAHGLVPVRCEGTRNQGYRYAPLRERSDTHTLRYPYGPDDHAARGRARATPRRLRGAPDAGERSARAVRAAARRADRGPRAAGERGDSAPRGRTRDVPLAGARRARDAVGRGSPAPRRASSLTIA